MAAIVLLTGPECRRIFPITSSVGPASDATGDGSVLAAQMAAEDFGGMIAGKPIKARSQFAKVVLMATPEQQPAPTVDHA